MMSSNGMQNGMNPPPAYGAPRQAPANHPATPAQPGGFTIPMGMHQQPNGYHHDRPTGPTQSVQLCYPPNIHYHNRPVQHEPLQEGCHQHPTNPPGININQYDIPNRHCPSAYDERYHPQPPFHQQASSQQGYRRPPARRYSSPPFVSETPPTFSHYLHLQQQANSGITGDGYGQYSHNPTPSSRPLAPSGSSWERTSQSGDVSRRMNPPNEEVQPESTTRPRAKGYHKSPLKQQNTPLQNRPEMPLAQPMNLPYVEKNVPSAFNALFSSDEWMQLEPYHLPSETDPDMVDAFLNGKTVNEQFAEMKEKHLPEGMSLEERCAVLEYHLHREMEVSFTCIQIIINNNINIKALKARSHSLSMPTFERPLTAPQLSKHTQPPVIPSVDAHFHETSNSVPDSSCTQTPCAKKHGRPLDSQAPPVKRPRGRPPKDPVAHKKKIQEAAAKAAAKSDRQDTNGAQEVPLRTQETDQTQPTSLNPSPAQLQIPNHMRAPFQAPAQPHWQMQFGDSLQQDLARVAVESDREAIEPREETDEQPSFPAPHITSDANGRALEQVQPAQGEQTAERNPSSRPNDTQDAPVENNTSESLDALSEGPVDSHVNPQTPSEAGADLEVNVATLDFEAEWARFERERDAPILPLERSAETSGESLEAYVSQAAVS